MKNKNAIQFTFNQPSYLEQLEIALITMDNVNYKSFDIIFLSNELCFQSKKFEKIEKIVKSKGGNFLKIDRLPNVDAILHWLIFPTLGEYDFIIKLDVDIMFLPNTDLNSMIREAEINNTALSGVEETITGKGKIRESHNRIKEMVEYFPEIDESLQEKFINGGVIVINNKVVKEHWPLIKEEIEMDIKKYNQLCDEKNLNHTDQNYIYIKFHKNIGYLNDKWNIRISHKDDIYKNKGNEGILHFCLKVFNFKNWKLEKIPYVEYYNDSIKNGNLEDFGVQNYKWLMRCKPSPWFPMKSLTKWGKHKKLLKFELRRISDLIINSAKND